MNAHFFAKHLLADHAGPTFNALRLRSVTNANGTESDVEIAIPVPLNEVIAADLKLMSRDERARCEYELAKLGHFFVDGEIVDVHQRAAAPSNVIKIDFVARAAKHAAAKLEAKTVVRCAVVDDCFVDSGETDAQREERWAEERRHSDRRQAVLNAPLVFRENASGE